MAVRANGRGQLGRTVENSPAAALQRRYDDGAERNAETGKATQSHVKTEAKWYSSDLASFLYM